MVFVEAPGGFGKSALALQLLHERDRVGVRAVVDELGDVCASVRTALAAAGLADLAAAVDPTDASVLAAAVAARPGGVGLAIDDVHRATPATRDWLVRLAAAVSAPSRLVLLGRRIGRDLAAAATAAPAGSFVTADDLRFDLGEATTVLRPFAVDDDTIVGVHRATAGWPAAVALAGARLGVGGHAPTGAGAGSLAELIERQLADVDPTTRSIVRTLAHLPLISAEVATQAVAPGALDALLDVGLPIRFRADGWGELADPVREHLTDGQRLGRDVVERVARVYATRGELLTACTFVVGQRQPSMLVDLLDRASIGELDSLGPPSLNLFVAMIGDDVLGSHLPLLTRLARVVEGIDPSIRSGWLDRAARLAATAGAPDHVIRAIAVERARDLGRQGRTDESFAILEDALATCATDELLTRGRAAFALGLGRLVGEQGSGSSRTVELLEQAASAFRAIGSARDEASARRALGFGVEFNRGAFEAAAANMTRAAELLSAPDSSRAMFLTFLAEIDRDLGRLDAADSALYESLSIGRRSGDATAVSYAAWGLALVAGERRDGAAVERWSAEARAHAAAWIDTVTGVDWYAMVGEVLLQLGDRDTGLAHVIAAEQHPSAGGYVWPARSVRARYEAVFGDPVVGESVLDELDAIAPPRERPLRLLMRAVCARRRDDAARAERLRRDALAASRALGDPSRLERREPELLALLRADDPRTATDSEGADASVLPTGVAIRMLGRFEVQAGDRDVTPPAGRAAMLLKVIALRGTLTVDAAIDLLWDDCDIDTGRARLRNLLNRIRTASGGVVERHGELLRLAAGIEVDVERFERAAARVSESDDAGRVGAARAALAIHTGDLLPGDPYADWAAAPRERIRRQHLALVDLVTRHCLDQRELDEALRLLDIAIEAEPYEVWRYQAAAEALRTQGRPAASALLAARGLAMLDDLGLPPDARLEALTLPDPSSG